MLKSKKETDRIVMVGPFPPPITGMSNVNFYIYELLKKNLDKEIQICDTSGPSLEKNIYYYIKRISKIFKTIIFLINVSKKDTIYFSISGGFGQIYELIFLIVLRLKRLRNIICHHHSYDYINNKRLISSLLFSIAGSETLHLSLSQMMAQKLKNKYSGIKRTMVLSNILFINDNESKILNKKQNKKITLGFISNISKEKGIIEFMDFHSSLIKKYKKINSIIAGPFEDKNIKKIIMKKIELSKRINWIGPVYDYKKTKFFESIDYLIFPTKYFNEAEPLVIYEAFSYNVPVISYSRGSIPEQIGLDELCGKLVLPNESFVESASSWIEKRLNYPKLFDDTKSAVRKNFIKQKIIANDAFQLLIKHF